MISHAPGVANASLCILMLMDEGSRRAACSRGSRSEGSSVSGRWQLAVTGCSSSAFLAQESWVPSMSLWQVKDLAGFPVGEEEPSLLPLNPPEAWGELITVYVCTVIPHEPLRLWSSQADCCLSTLFCRRRSLQRNTLDGAY